MDKKKKKVSFLELYRQEQAKPAPPTPAQEFINRCAEATDRSPATVKMWLTTYQRPEKLVCKILAEHLGVDPDGLFPETENPEQP